jgi:hypothetical protein
MLPLSWKAALNLMKESTLKSKINARHTRFILYLERGIIWLYLWMEISHGKEDKNPTHIIYLFQKIMT